MATLIPDAYFWETGVFDHDDDTVPTYTELDPNSITDFLDSIPVDRLVLPLTRYPNPPYPTWDSRLRRTVQPTTENTNIIFEIPSTEAPSTDGPAESTTKKTNDSDNGTVDNNNTTTTNNNNDTTDPAENNSTNHDTTTDNDNPPSYSPSPSSRSSTSSPEPTTPPGHISIPATGPLSDPAIRALHALQRRLIATFFNTIPTKNTELLTLFITRGLVSPDLPDAAGRTPLIAAVEAGNGQMVCTLIGLGARVDGYGSHAGAERTPLMAAAALGNIALVKLLRESFSADDAIIAPDGQLALRLAADNGHREVVDYLPVRRGGAWRRWQVAHAVALGRIYRAWKKIVRFVQFFVWDVPKFFVWTVPKHVVVKPAAKSAKYCWTNRGRFSHWCKRQVVEFPSRVGRAGKAVGKATKELSQAVVKGAKKAPGKIWKVIKEIPKVINSMLKWLWRFIKAIPAAIKTVALYLWSTLKRIGGAIGNVFLKIISALHTLVSAVLTFFRKITLKDVWNGICDVLRAVFVGLPAAVWKGVLKSGEVAWKVLTGLFGCVGMAVYFLFAGLLWVAQYVPRQLGEMAAAVWASLAKGWHEVMVWVDPKYS